jgi:uncharacterized membrane protein YoaK (UPF0700 family)
MRPLSIDASPATKLLPFVLSIAAGATDVIGFLGLRLFTAHITGNLVILAASLVVGRAASLAEILAVPVFVVMLVLSALFAAGLEKIDRCSLRPLLMLHFLLLAGFLTLCVSAGPRFDPAAPNAVLAGMLGVSAMAVQNAFVQISLKDAPVTAVMTTDITRFVMDIGRVLFASDPREIAGARMRARHTWPAILGFTLGCALGAAFEAAFGFWSLALPTGFALLALALGLSVGTSRPQPSISR